MTHGQVREASAIQCRNAESSGEVNDFTGVITASWTPLKEGSRRQHLERGPRFEVPPPSATWGLWAAHHRAHSRAGIYFGCLHSDTPRHE